MAESRSDLALASSLRLLKPLVELLLREGVPYPAFARALKSVFLEAAENILAADGARASDSNISTLSGVHRKDVRAWRSEGEPSAPVRGLGTVMEVYARWASDPGYCTRAGKPKVLKRSGFDALARSVSKDVHPRTILEELLRVGVVRRMPAAANGEERLALCADAFVPRQGNAEMLELFADNAGDHIAAAVHNLNGGEPMLEQSVFADGLRPQSAAALSAQAREIWAKAFREIMTEAGTRYRHDQGMPDANQRIRFGMYFFQGINDPPQRGDA